MELEQLQGSSLDGDRFRLEELMGQGGYGAVFRAVQTSMERPCALKVLHAKFIEADNVISRFKAEARATSSLRHPNTVVIYDYGHDAPRGLFYIAMEFLEGTSLHAMIKARGRLDLDIVMRLVPQIAQSLQDAHDKSIVHRDIKPHNIMVVRQAGEPYFVKVIDFGIAKITHGDNLFEGTRELTQTGTMIGTPLYMAPEQIREGGKVDGRTDMYALGMCIYKMLLGHTPYQGMETWEIIGKHMAGPPHPLRYYEPDLKVSDDFERVLQRALQRNKDDRYPSILEFARALQTVCERDGLLHGHAHAHHDTMLLPHIEATTPMPSRRGAPIPRERDAVDAHGVTHASVEPRRDPLHTAKRATSRTQAVSGGIQPRGEHTVEGVLTPSNHTADVAHSKSGLHEGVRGTDTLESEPSPRHTSQRRLILLVVALVISGLVLAGILGIATTLDDTRDTLPEPVVTAPEVPDAQQPVSIQQGILGAQQGVATALVTSTTTLPKKEKADIAPPRKVTPKAPEAKKTPDHAPTRVVHADIKEPPTSTKPPAATEKPTPEPPAPTLQATEFVVIPYGDLYVDGKKVPGKGKRTLDLTPGVHKAHVIKDGKKSPSKRFTVKAGVKDRVQFKLFNL